MIIDWTVLARAQPALRAAPASLRQAARLQEFSAGQILYHRGERPDAMLCVLSGEVRLVRHSAAGGEIVVQRSRDGFIAEASIDTDAYHCDVLAAEAGAMLLFPRSDFRAALEQDAEFNRQWIARLSRELRQQRARNERLALNSAEARIRHYIESEGRHGCIQLRGSRKAWAYELGLSHEALYRTLRRLQDNGILTIDGANIRLA